MKPALLNAIGVVAIVVVAAGASVFSLSLAFGVVVLGLVAVAASRWTYGALVVGLALIALVPIYWVPDIPGTKVGLYPVVFVCLALAPAAWRLRSAFRLTVLDQLLVAYVVLASLSYLVNATGGVGSVAAALIGVAFPYATTRLLGLRVGVAAAAAYGVVIGGVVSAAIALREYRGVPNPFFAYFRSGHAHRFFARADERLGHLRPEAAFGHAIALGMFLVLATVLALGLAWRQNPRVPRALLYGAALLTVLALTDNLVRGPLLMLGFASVVLLFSESRRGRHGRGILVAGAMVVLVNLGSFANVFQLRDASFEKGGRVEASSEVRVEIWRVITTRENFSLLGRTVVDENGIGFVEAVGQGVGISSFDNGFALIYVGFGILALLAFIGIGIAVAHAAIVARVSVLHHAWAAAILAAFINLMTVNLLTQFAHFFWLAIGLIGAAVQITRHGPDTAEVSALAPEPDALAAA